MEEKVLSTILKNGLIKKGDRVGVGLSGGSDSMALVCCLMKLQKNLDFELVAIHINHNLRGCEAKRDELFVQEFCNSNGIKCIVKSVDVKALAKAQKHTIEQSARELRYKAFEEVAGAEHLDSVALAHHKNDQAETILMHIGRGCGLNGLIGMRYKSGKYIRPLLDITKNEIARYIETEKINFVEDSTNESDEYKRNYVRHNLLKMLENAYPGAISNLVKLSHLAEKDEEYIQSMIPKNYIQERPDGVVLVNNAEELHTAIFSRLARECFSRLGSVVDVENLHIDALYDLFKNEVGKRLDMPNGVIAVKCYDGVLLKKPTITNNVVIPFDNYEFEFYGQGYKVEKSKEKLEKNKNKLFFDLDKVPKGSVWRNYSSDDMFTKFGGGTKKVKDYLVSKKVDSERRKILPCLCFGNECLLIAEIEISDKLRIDENTKRIGILQKIK